MTVQQGSHGKVLHHCQMDLIQPSMELMMVNAPVQRLKLTQHGQCSSVTSSQLQEWRSHQILVSSITLYTNTNTEIFIYIHNFVLVFSMLTLLHSRISTEVCHCWNNKCTYVHIPTINHQQIWSFVSCSGSLLWHHCGSEQCVAIISCNWSNIYVCLYLSVDSSYDVIVVVSNVLPSSPVTGPIYIYMSVCILQWTPTMTSLW